jgi:RNA polymerase sigma-70 factor (ECF subfamily)
MATDSEILQQIKRSDTTAFGRLVQKYQAEIFSICQAILKNPQDAEEAAQDTFVQAYLKLDQLKQPDKFFPWLRQIAKNLSKNYRRRRQEDIIAMEQLTDEPGMQATPDESVLRQELMEAVMEAIETLPSKDRKVIRAYMDGLSHEAISDKLGISYQASMSRLYRARKKITAQVKHLLSGVIGLPKMFASLSGLLRKPLPQENALRRDTGNENWNIYKDNGRRHRLACDSHRWIHLLPRSYAIAKGRIV